jgi:hypothetical protein
LLTRKFPNDKKKEKVLLQGISEPDFSLVGQRLITGQKEGKIMKTLKAAAILFLAGNMAFTTASAAGVSGVIWSRTQSDDGGGR